VERSQKGGISLARREGKGRRQGVGGGGRKGQVAGAAREGGEGKKEGEWKDRER